MHNFKVASSILLMTKYVSVYYSLFCSFITTSFCSPYHSQILVLLYPQMPSVKIKFLWDHRNVSSLHQKLSLCWLLVDSTSVYTALAWVLESGCWCLTQHSLSVFGCCSILFSGLSDGIWTTCKSIIGWMLWETWPQSWFLWYDRLSTSEL